MGKLLKETFSKVDIYISSKHIKKCSTSLVIRETKFKTHNEISLYTKMSIIMIFKKKRKISVGEHLEKLEPSCFASGNMKWCSHCGKQLGGFSKH